MNRTEAAKYLDVVSGVIIGEVDTNKRARLFADGRPQSNYFEAQTDAELRPQAQAWIDKMKREMGEPEYKRVWPNGFELRIWDRH